MCALDRAEALLGSARVGGLAANVDVDVDPTAVTQRELEPGADLDDAERRLPVERRQDRLGAGMAAAPLVVDGPVETTGEGDATVDEHLEHGQHHGLARLVRAHALAEHG